MRKILVAGVLAGATLFAPGLVPEARASHDWLAFGTAFRVGAAHISFIFGRPSFAYEPAYYYRYDRPISYRGHSCSRACFHDDGYYYHHQSCPLVGAHFRSYDVDPYRAFDRYAPRYDGYDRGYGQGGRYRDDGRYREHGRYRGDGRYRGESRDHGRYDDRNDRDDRRDRYDRDRRDRHRGRGHRHHRGCDH